MKKIIVILSVILSLSACVSNNMIYSNKKYCVYEDNKNIKSWAEADTYDDALFQCKKQIIQVYYPEVLSNDPDHNWLSFMTSISVDDLVVVEHLTIENTGRHYVCIEIPKDKYPHFVRRE